MLVEIETTQQKQRPFIDHGPLLAPAPRPVARPWVSRVYVTPERAKEIADAARFELQERVK